MNNKNFAIKKEIIKETFNDPRKIKCITPEDERRLDECVHPGDDIFTTEDGEYIDLEIIFEDFDEVELAKYVEFAENLYEKHHKHVSVYLLCPENVNVLVREFEIRSRADFTIRLARVERDWCKVALDTIKNKICCGEKLNHEDLDILKEIPVRCDKKRQNYYRIECFRIINRYFY